MIHDIAIWKLVLAGFVLACLSFLVGFIIAACLAASGRASRMEERIMQGYQPDHGILDDENPPQGGSGVPEF